MPRFFDPATNKAGTSNTKVASDMLLQKELKDVAAKDCNLL